MGIWGCYYNISKTIFNLLRRTVSLKFAFRIVGIWVEGTACGGYGSGYRA